MLANPQDPKLH